MQQTSEYKIRQNEYKIRHDRVGDVIRLELCKRLKFDNTDKWYMHKSKSVLKKTLNSSGLWDTNESFNPDQKTNTNEQKEKNFSSGEFCYSSAS